ncbi:ethylene-responsive transcription factor ERF017-like [Lotus japonicus]|uniref:ethylene-responsive transcription factor ERF017-like n=1 Tax=Lotus japonicus TaxID=34305 RepID=UPI002590E246|nr:ethylene-responsive transcription factor ERF017-like [Lotus japonicus]
MASSDPIITTTSTTTTPSCNINLACTTNISNSSSNVKLYKGVRKRKWGKWVSEIRLPNSRERIWLGSYDTQEKAARAFDAALYCLRGRHATFNFPDTPHKVELHCVGVGDQSLSPEEIREVAAKFANNMEVIQEQEGEGEGEGETSQQHGADDLFESNINTSITESSPSNSCSLNDSYDMGYGDMRTLDWTISDMLDDLNNGVNAVGSDFGLYYSGPDNNMEYSDELCSVQHPTLFEDEMEGGDAFSNHSFLWSWSF